MDRVHARCDDALGDSDAVDLAKKIRSRQVSAGEVVEAAINRLHSVEPTLNGLAFEALDQARQKTAAGRLSGFFAGIPTFVKDDVDVAGMPTMQGTDAWVPKPAKTDGRFVSVFRRTGVLPLGKTQMSEFGFNASAEHPRLGPVRNPWDPDRTAGASSAGSAAFVAAGVVPVAHGTDGGGSIRIPASCTGLVGLKPSRYRLPMEQDMREMPVRIVTSGLLTRSVRDTAAFLRETEQLWRARQLPPIGDVAGPGKRRLKIVVVTHSILKECSPEVRELTLNTATLLEQRGHRVELRDRLPVPSYFLDDFPLYWAVLAMAAVRTGRWPWIYGRTFNRELLDNLTLGLDRYARLNLHRVPRALVRLSRLRRFTDQLFQTYDVMLTPTVAHETPRIGFDTSLGYGQIIDRLIDWVAFTPLQNVTGEPAVSLPLAQSANGLPQGMMFAAAMGQEALLLGLAFELEETHPWLHT